MSDAGMGYSELPPNEVPLLGVDPKEFFTRKSDIPPGGIRTAGVVTLPEPEKPRREDGRLYFLRDKIAANPAAFDFSVREDGTPWENKEEHAAKAAADLYGKPASLNSMLGLPEAEGFESRGMTFYPQEMTLGELERIYHEYAKYDENYSNPVEQISALARVGTYFLFVQGEDGKLRKATVEEIKEHIGPRLLKQLAERYTGLEEYETDDGKKN